MVAPTGHVPLTMMMSRARLGIEQTKVDVFGWSHLLLELGTRSPTERVDHGEAAGLAQTIGIADCDR